ncbi:MAG: hypothetical protein AAF735_00815 [Myxococcota bacterium]
MSDSRKCRRCGGEEFQMRTESGAVIEWRGQLGQYRTWFCVECDWRTFGDAGGDERTAYSRMAFPSRPVSARPEPMAAIASNA